MATAKLERVEQNVLTCSICLSKFTDPVTLTCQHSYCRECIGEHIVTKSAVGPGQSILCPVCNQDIRVPALTGPVKEWAGQLRPSMVIQGLMDSLDTPDVQQGDVDLPCTPCQQLGETTPGAMWCPDCDTILCDKCVKMHRVLPASASHDVVEKSQKDNPRKRRKQRCSKHIDKNIEIYCQDCDDVFCHSCYVDYHRDCKRVQSLESKIPQLKAGLISHGKYLSRKSASVDRQNQARKQIMEQISTDKDSVQHAIKSSTQRAIDLARKKERKLMERLESLTEGRLQKLQADVKRGDLDRQIFQQFGEYIDHTLKSNCEMDILRLFQTLTSGDLDIEQKIGTNKTKQLVSVTFDKTNENIDKTLTNLRLGDIVSHNVHGVEGSTPVLQSTTEIRVKSDKKVPELTDITVLDVEGVKTTVVTDSNNKCVKSFFIKHSHASHSELKLDGIPWGMTKLEEKKVMIAIRWNKQIVTVAATPALVLLSTVNTEKRYFSLTVLNPTTIAAGGDYCVDILNMQGQVMKSLATLNNVELFSSPWHMCVDMKGHLLVSDGDKKCVTCVAPGGRVVWRYRPKGERALGYPFGITTTHTGDILLEDKLAKKVIQLSKSGQYVRDVPLERNEAGRSVGIVVDSQGSLFVNDFGEVKEIVFI